MIISLTIQLVSPVIRPYSTDMAVTHNRTGRPNFFVRFTVVNCTAVAIYGAVDGPSQAHSPHDKPWSWCWQQQCAPTIGRCFNVGDGGDWLECYCAFHLVSLSFSIFSVLVAFHTYYSSTALPTLPRIKSKSFRWSLLLNLYDHEWIWVSCNCLR